MSGCSGSRTGRRAQETQPQRCVEGGLSALIGCRYGDRRCQHDPCGLGCRRDRIGQRALDAGNDPVDIGSAGTARIGVNDDGHRLPARIVGAPVRHLDPADIDAGQGATRRRPVEDARRIAEIGKDIERRIPTSGDAFAITVGGQSFTERKPAGRALMKEIMTLVHLREEGETTIARIGGFDLVFSGQRLGQDDFRYDVTLVRTGAETGIDLALTVTPLGAVSRVEHVLSGFEEERAQYRFRLDDAKRRLASYQSRQGGEFGFEEELAEKRRQLTEIERNLADDVATVALPTEQAA